MNAEEIKKAREICGKYDKLPITPYSKCRKTNRDDCLNQAILILPACLDEIERLQAENAKLSIRLIKTIGAIEELKILTKEQLAKIDKEVNLANKLLNLENEI